MARNFRQSANSAESPVDAYQKITDRLIELLETGVAPWRKPWSSAVAGAPANLVSGKNYNGINNFILGAAPYESRHWLTFKQAQELGGHVMKGEKGSPVVFCKTYLKDVESEDGSETLKETRLALRYYTVFNVEQCAGIDYEKPEIALYPENERIEKAENIQLFMPNRPTVNYGGGRAYYRRDTDVITVPELARYEKPAEYYSTLFHELAHSTGHESRLNRHAEAPYDGFGGKNYSKEELIAEMTSAFLCGHCGIDNDTIENSAAYLEGWIKALRGDKKLAVSAAAQAQKAANYILNIQPQADAE